jgi:hypothetical protein
MSCSTSSTSASGALRGGAAVGPVSLRSPILAALLAVVLLDFAAVSSSLRTLFLRELPSFLTLLLLLAFFLLSSRALLLSSLFHFFPGALFVLALRRRAPPPLYGAGGHH